MANSTLSSFIVSSTGLSLTCSQSGGTWSGTKVIDSSKTSLTVTGTGFDNTGAGTTPSRNIQCLDVSYSAGTFTMTVSRAIHSSETVTVSFTAGAITDGTDTTLSFSGSATNNSTLSYPRTIWHWISPPHDRHTSAPVLQAKAIHPYGIEAIKFGITQESVITTTAGGITGTFTWTSSSKIETVSFSGGGKGILAAGTVLTGSGSAKTLRLYLDNRYATPANGETVTGDISGATAVISSIIVGEVITNTQIITTNRNRRGNYGPSLVDDIWQATLVATQNARYQRWATVYPTIGSSKDTRDYLQRTAQQSEDGEIAKGEWEIYCDPANAENSKQKTYYVDNSSQASCTSISGNFGAFDYCLVKSAGVLQTVVVSIGNNSNGTQTAGGTTFRWCNLPYNCSIQQMSSLTSVVGTPQFGDIMLLNTTWGGNGAMGYVLEYSGGVLTYIKCSAASFSTSQAVQLFDNNNNILARSFTTSTPTTISGTIANGHNITSANSGATCTLTSSITINGSDSNTGLSSSVPLKTSQKAISLAAASRGDGVADGCTIYYLPCHYGQTYNGSLDTETRDYWVTHTAAPGFDKTVCRMTSYNPAAASGDRTNFQKFTNLTFWCLNSNDIVLDISSSVTGSYDRRSLWVVDCDIFGLFRWTQGRTNTLLNSGGWNWVQFLNCKYTRCYSNNSSTSSVDCYYEYISNDVFTKNYGVINCEIYDIDSSGDVTFHADIFQMSTDSYGNRVVWNMAVKKASGVQMCPFISDATTNIQNGFAMVNCLQDTDYSFALSQISTGTDATITQDSYYFINSTFLDGLSIGPKEVTGGATHTIKNFWYYGCLFDNVQVGGSLSTLVGNSKGLYQNCHVVGTWNGSPGASGSTGSSWATLVGSTGSTSSNFLIPSANSLIINRDLYSSRPKGYPSHDIYGRSISVDSLAKASIGAAQPIASITATFGGSGFTSGSTINLGTITSPKNLVLTVSGATGSVFEISSVTGGGGMSVASSSNILTCGGLTQSATYSYSLVSTSGSGIINYGPSGSSQYIWNVNYSLVGGTVGNISSVSINGSSPWNGWVADIIVTGFTGNASYNLGTAGSTSTSNFYITLNDYGFNSSGLTTTYPRIVYGTVPVKKAANGISGTYNLNDERITGGSNLNIKIALSDYVYSNSHNLTAVLAPSLIVNSAGSGQTSDATSITASNNSGKTYSSMPPIAKWGVEQRRPVFGVNNIEILGTHRFGCNGIPFACVKWNATGQSSNKSLTGTISSMSFSSIDSIPVYQASLDLSITAGFTRNEVVNIDFEVFPWIGDTTNVLRTTSQPNTLKDLSTLKWHIMDKIIAVVDPISGSDTTGGADANQTTANTLACKTITGGLAQIRAKNNSLYTLNVLDGGELQLKSGNYLHGASNISTSATVNSYVTIMPHSSSSIAGVTFTGPETVGANTQYQFKYEKLKNITINRSSGNFPVFGGANDLLICDGIQQLDTFTNSFHSAGALEFINGCKSRNNSAFKSTATDSICNLNRGSSISGSSNYNIIFQDNRTVINCTVNNTTCSLTKFLNAANSYLFYNVQAKGITGVFFDTGSSLTSISNLGLVNTLFEKIDNDSNPVWENGSISLKNTCIHFCTFPGERINIQSGWSLNGLSEIDNIMDQNSVIGMVSAYWSWKGDEYSHGGGYTFGNGGLTGAWPHKYGVGFVGNVNEDPLDHFPPNYYGMFASRSITFAGFVSDKSVNAGYGSGTGAGYGDYRGKTGSVMLSRISNEYIPIPRDINNYLLSLDPQAKASSGYLQPTPSVTTTFGGSGFISGATLTMGTVTSPKNLIVTVTGLTGAVLEITSLTAGGSVSVSNSTAILTYGGLTQSATFAFNLLGATGGTGNAAFTYNPNSSSTYSWFINYLILKLLYQSRSLMNYLGTRIGTRKSL